MWQEVEKLEPFDVPPCIASAAVKLVLYFLDAGDPAVGMAVEVGTHISKDNKWHMWLGVCPYECDSPLVGSPGKVPGNSLRPRRCVFHGPWVWIIPSEDCCPPKNQAEGVWAWEKLVHQFSLVIRPGGGNLGEDSHVHFV